MSENNKTREFLRKLAPCIERGELDVCVEEAARLAREMGMEAGELLELSAAEGENGKHDFAYVIALAAAQDLKGEVKGGAYTNAGFAAHNLKKIEKAEQLYKQAIEADSKLAVAYYIYANLLREQKRNDEAEQYYKQAIEVDPKLAAAHYNYANLLYELNKKKEAEQQYKLAIETEPKLASAHNNYANLLRKNAQYSEAEKEIRIALQIEPRNPFALGSYGDILADEDYFEEAIEKYHEAIKNSDSIEHMAKAEIHNNLGWVYVHVEQHYRAGKEFEGTADERIFVVPAISSSIIFWFENHRERRGHREKWQPSEFSVYSVVDYLCKYSFSQKKLKSLINFGNCSKPALEHLPNIFNDILKEKND